MAKRVAIIVGHPDSSSYNAALAKAYAQGLAQAGHEVRTLALGELQFNPILQPSAQQDLEPDLQAAQASIAWADHVCLVYPIWWGGMPALLKGFIDRVFLSGFAYRYAKGQLRQEQLLKGKTSQQIVTLDTPKWYYHWFYRLPIVRHSQLTILDFCGIKAAAPALIFSPMISASAEQREHWLAKVTQHASQFN